MGRSVQIPDPPQRIISLVPSQTELLHDLGLGERVVGITRFCVHPEEWFRTKPRVGGTKKVDIEKVRALKPDLIIGNKEENERKDIEQLEKEYPVWMSDVRDLEGALDMILRIGEFTGSAERAVGISASIKASFRTLRPLRPVKRAAYLIWRDPWMAAGRDTFIQDMLGRIGLTNVFAAWDGRYPQFSAEELRKAAPAIVLLASEPFPFKDAHVTEVRAFLPEATFAIVDGEAFSWYGSRLLHAPAYFNGLVAGWTV
ncbi:MAG: ABC transporter substrate-binding protein [Flavobacteriales bacterium]|nr:ABC transporter substrate-binding protein [Flavobacteriales bacterium]